MLVGDARAESPMTGVPPIDLTIHPGMHAGGRGRAVGIDRRRRRAARSMSRDVEPGLPAEIDCWSAGRVGRRRDDGEVREAEPARACRASTARSSPGVRRGDSLGPQFAADAIPRGATSKRGIEVRISRTIFQTASNVSAAL